MKKAVSKVDSFEEFLRKKQDDGKHFDWETRQAEWLESVDNLYQKVTKWMKPFVDKSLLKIDGRPHELHDGYFGTYRTKRFEIILGTHIISLVPIGTLIYGAKGRVDLVGPKGDVILIEEEWDQWEVASSVRDSDSWPLTKASFQNAFLMVVNGC
jgi:hypothetical protein